MVVRLIFNIFNFNNVKCPFTTRTLYDRNRDIYVVASFNAGWCMSNKLTLNFSLANQITQ